MRIAAVRLRMKQGEAVEAALIWWLKDLRYGYASRFKDLEDELTKLAIVLPRDEPSLGH
jgi:hypothetical protein